MPAATTSCPSTARSRTSGAAEIQRIVLQLVDLDFLDRSPGDRPVLTVTAAGQRLLRGGAEVKLRAPEPEAPVCHAHR